MGVCARSGCCIPSASWGKCSSYHFDNVSPKGFLSIDSITVFADVRAPLVLCGSMADALLVQELGQPFVLLFLQIKRVNTVLFGSHLFG